MRNMFVVVLLVMVIPACTWVKLIPEAEKVRVLDDRAVQNCKKLGKTTVSLKATVAGFKRNPDKVKKELETLARNHALDLDGDTVVPISVPEEGQQVFNVYRCNNR